MEMIKIFPDAEFYLLPVIQTCPLNFFALQGKPQWFDQMQLGSGGHTRSADVARVPVDLRWHQNDVALWLLHFGFGESFMHWGDGSSFYNFVLQIDWLNSWLVKSS